MPVTSNIVEIPDELLEVQQDLTLSMDGLTVNSLKFLSTISHDLYYRTAQYVARPVASIYEECMDELLALYKRGGFTISAIHCNNKFRKVMNPLSARQDPPITINYAGAQENVPRAERNNRVIQERVRAAYHWFPLTHLPRILVKYLVMESTKKLNFFHNKNGVSKYFSPRMTMHKELWTMHVTASTKSVNTCKLMTSQITQIRMHQDPWIASTCDKWTMPREAMSCCICRQTELSNAVG
jgi:hypothetical protein